MSAVTESRVVPCDPNCTVPMCVRCDLPFTDEEFENGPAEAIRRAAGFSVPVALEIDER